MTGIVVDCEQRSPAWYAARAGLLTASDAAAMLSREKKVGEGGKSELRLRLALESLRGAPLPDKHFVGDYMRAGMALEPEAVGAYEAVTGEIVQAVGFVRHATLPVGCSPDGIVGDYDGGLELKCPKYTTHYEYLRKGTLPSEYAAQVTHSLFVTGLPWWDFCSYCPEFGDGPLRLFTVRVWRDGLDLTAYELAVHLFLSEVESLADTLRSLSAPELTHA